MARSISSTLIQDLLKQSSEEGLIPLLTLSWNDGVYSGTMRVAANTDVAITSNGNSFPAGDFSVELPDEDDTNVPLLRIGIQDADQAVRTQLRRLDTRFPATATLQLVRLTNTDAVEQTFSGTVRIYTMTLTSLVASVETFVDLSREPLTPFRMSPAYGFNALRAR